MRTMQTMQTMRWAVLLLCGACTQSTSTVDDASTVLDGGAASPDGGATASLDSGPRRDASTPPPLPRFPGLPTSCWLPPGSDCNPATNEGCGADEACDIARDESDRIVVVCFPPPATEDVGARCDNSAGPHCRGGLRCMEGFCRDTCCDDRECTAPGERCVPLDPRAGTLGVCSAETGPSCGGPGAFCRGAEDCCSRDCHFDHCH
jgi:hypothetical protein